MQFRKTLLSIVVLLLVFSLTTQVVYASPASHSAAASKNSKTPDSLEEFIEEWGEAFSDFLRLLNPGKLKFNIVSGTVVSTQTTRSQPTITIKDSKGKSNTYSMGNGVKTFLNGKSMKVAELQPGDHVKLLLNPASHVILIEAKSTTNRPVPPVTDNRVTGTIQQVLSQDNLRAVIIKQGNTSTTYVLNSNAKVTFKDWAKGTFTDIQTGEKVTARLTDGRISELLVEPVYTLDQGNMTAVSQTAVSIRRTNETTQAYPLHQRLTLTIEGQSNPKISDLLPGDILELRIRDGYVVAMDAIRGWTLNGSIQAVINANSQKALTIQFGNTTQTYLLSNTAVVNVKNHSAATWDGLRAGDKVNIRLIDDRIVHLEAELTYTVDEGTITSITRTGDRYVVIQRSNDALQLYAIAPYYQLVVPGKTNPTLNDIQVGDKVMVQLHGGRAAILTVIRGQAYSGTITNVYSSGTTRQLTIRQENNTSITHTLASDAIVSIKDQPQATFADLRTGDKVTIRVVDNRVVHLEAEFTYTTVTGPITALNTNTRQITIQTTASSVQTYTLPTNVTLTIEGKTNPTLGDIVLGDQAEIKIRNNAVAYLNVNPATIVSGTVETIVNTNAVRAISIKKADGQVVTFTLASNAVVTIKDQSNASFGSLVAGDLVTVRLSDNVVVRLEAEYYYTTVQGTVTQLQINTSPRKIHLQAANSTSSQVYTLAVPCTLTIEGKTNPQLSDIAIGDHAEFKIRGDLVRAVDVVPAVTRFNAFFVRRTGSNTAPGIEVIRNNLVVNYNMAPSYTVIVPGKSSATLADLQAGNNIQIEMANGLVQRITVVQ